MSDTKTYTAITIGPIYDTIMLTSSPVGLWAASYLFSHISRRICEMIIEHTDESGNKIVESAKEILSPYFPTEKEKIEKKETIKIDGIGRYHDRIVFIPSDPDTVLDKLGEIFKAIVKEIAGAFNENPDKKGICKDYTDWFESYLQLHAVCFESGGNPLLACSRYLDAIELEKTFPAFGDNPLANLLDSDEETRNITIRDKICETFSEGKWPFPKYKGEKGNEHLPDMTDITGRSAETTAIEALNLKIEDRKPIPKRRKINSYYAIVQTDGDHFGKYIKEKLEQQKDQRDFSRICLNYCTDSAALVKAYGGIPIYAGGDDLLFIAPLTEKIIKEDGTISDGKRTIFDLLVGLREIFENENHFKKDKESPTLSLGVAIRFYKYPLYEAFGEAVKQLFDKAKKARNSAAISLQKHSGQTAEFILEKFNETSLTEDLNTLINKNVNDEVLTSVRSKIWEFQPLFTKAVSLGESALKNVFDNTFDSDIHKNYEDVLTSVRSFLLKLEPPQKDVCDKAKEYKKKHKIGEEINLSHETEENLKMEVRFEMLDCLLRVAKFWKEEGDDVDDNNRNNKKTD